MAYCLLEDSELCDLQVDLSHVTYSVHNHLLSLDELFGLLLLIHLEVLLAHLTDYLLREPQLSRHFHLILK